MQATPFLRGARRTRRRRVSRRAIPLLIQALEPRRLLTTFVVDGTNNIDTWTISANPGSVTVNGTTTVSAGITDVQVLHDKGKLIPADWAKRLPNNSSP